VIVSLNGERAEIPDGASVRDVLELVGAPARGVAVAVNGEVVPASRWSSTSVRAQDRLEVLTAAQGG
jgi:sulfur carrier protein